MTLLLALAGCVGERPPPGPVVSPTGIVFETGTPPVETRYSQTAMLYLRSETAARAAEFAEEGIESDPDNPVHHFVAGVAYARLGRYAEADARFAEAERLYPAYALEIEPEREAAWAEAFNRGIEAYARGDVDRAIEAWRGAVAIYDLRPEAHRNLAALLAEEGRYDEAADVYRRALTGLAKRPVTRVLGDAEQRQREEVAEQVETTLADVFLIAERFDEAEPLLSRQLEREPGSVQLQQKLATALTGLGRYDEASAIYDDLLSEGRLEDIELFNVGVALFRAGDFQRAAEAFGRLVEIRRESRDAWFNYVNALFAAGDWQTLVRAGARLMELDPLNENAGLIAARAHLETGDNQAALAGLRQVEAAPVFVDGLVLRRADGGTRIQGRVTGNTADAGTAMRLRFTFYGDDGALGAETITIPAPPPGESRTFEVAFHAPASAYRYEVVD